MTTVRTVTDIIDSDYKKYALYTIRNRAIPSLFDGMKNVHRKLYFAAVKENAYSKEIKCADLAGTLSRYEYLHGEVSAADALIKMAQTFSNNLPIFCGHGNFGSRLVPEASAARYIYVTLNKLNVFTDSLVEEVRGNLDDPEPLFYNSVIPLSLVNGSVGIAVGYATNILPRSVADVVAAVKAVINNKPIKTLVPTLPSFSGTVVNNGAPNKWLIKGIVNKSTTTRYIVEEIPWGVDRTQYYNFLTDLVDSGKIVDFSDDCSSGVRFAIKVTREQATTIDKNPEQFFGLVKAMGENYTLLDENGGLIVFDTAEDIVKYFVNVRLKIKEKSIIEMLIQLASKNTQLDNKMTFLRKVLSDKSILTTYTKLHELAVKCGDAKFVDVPIKGFTEEKINELQQELDSNTRRMVELNEKSTDKQLLDDIEIFKKSFDSSNKN